MESFEHYHKQFDRAREEVLTDKTRKEEDVSIQLKTLFRRHETKFNRTVAMLGILRKVTPFEVKYEYKTEHLPIDPEKYEFKEGVIGKGGENDVYLLEAKEQGLPSWVLKMNHQDGGNVSNLVRRAKEIKDEYEIVKKRFADIPGFVPEEYSLIMENPRDGKPAITTIQKYYGTDIMDVFQVMVRGELPRALEKNPKLKQDVFDFIRISDEMERETGNMVDLIGPKNVSLADIDGEQRLILLDPHLISNPWRSETVIKERQTYQMDYLRYESGYTDFQNERAAA